MLQIIYGKEYSYVLEIKIDENDIKIGEELLSIDFIYEDIFNNNIINTNLKYKYELKSLNYVKANEEYIRSKVYSILEEVMKLNEMEQKSKVKNFIKSNKKLA